MNAAATQGMSPLVSADWLRVHLGGADILVLDARIGPADGNLAYSTGRTSFEQDGHIPGARFADLFSAFSDPAGSFLFTRPKADVFAGTVQYLGVNERSDIIVCDSSTGAWAARVWWVLRAYGHARVRVLDGGLNAWIATGGALEFGTAAIPLPGDFMPVAQDGYFVDVPEVLAVVEGRTTAHLVCASQRPEFTGAASPDPRRGHIPGSFNSPYRDMLDEFGRIDIDRVRLEARRIGLDGPNDVLLYCGGGINAAGLALGLVAAGYTSPKIFDGSMNEWRADAALPVETGPERRK